MHDLSNYPHWLHMELLNWSRWCWSGAWPHPMPPNQCASFEHNYKRTNEENTTDDARPIPPNVDRALIVDKVWRELPDMPRRALRAEYPQFHESGRAEHGRVGAARRMGIRLREYEAALFLAIDRIWKTFEGKR